MRSSTEFQWTFLCFPCLPLIKTTKEVFKKIVQTFASWKGYSQFYDYRFPWQIAQVKWSYSNSYQGRLVLWKNVKPGSNNGGIFFPSPPWSCSQLSSQFYFLSTSFSKVGGKKRGQSIFTLKIKSCSFLRVHPLSWCCRYEDAWILPPPPPTIPRNVLSAFTIN